MPKYWGQISFAFLVAAVATYIANEIGSTLGSSIAIGALIYIAVRWLITSIYRTRYWVQNPGYDSRSCPNCKEYIYRVSGDWILECKRCGWTAGWPAIRWLTHSVPSIQFRRTIAGPKFIVFVFIGLLLISGMATTVTNSTITGLQNQSLSGLADLEADPDTDQQSTEEPDSLDRNEIEELIHTEVNEERSNHGLSKLSYDSELAAIARYHSEDMAENDYFSHTALDGSDMGDRYQRFEYDCRVPAGGNRYYTGAENIAYTYYKERIQGGEYHGSAGDVAEGIVSQWMNSPGHRENILRSEWRSEGIGVAITETAEGTRVYATQNFC